MQPIAAPEIKGVFFDLYGTLLILGDMKRAWSDWMEVLYAALCPEDMPVTRENFDDCCHQFFRQEEPMAEADDHLTVFERRICRLAANLNSSIELPLLKKTASNAVNAWQAHVRLDPEAVTVLTALMQRRTLGLISNFDHPPHAHRILSETGLDQCFQTIVISGEIGIKKPDPRIFQIALKQTELAAEDVIYVGDTQEDVDGAIAAGIRPILIARPEESHKPRILDYTRRDEQASDRIVLNYSPTVTTISALPEILSLVDCLHTTNVR